MNSEAALTETWIVWIFNPGATIIRSSSCYESDSRYTKHYQQFWRYHNYISGLMPLINSYLTTILVRMLWHSGELHILTPLALLLNIAKEPIHVTHMIHKMIIVFYPSASHCSWPLGLHSLSCKTSYHQILWSLEAARLGVMIIVALWNFTGISAVLLPWCLSNFKAIGKV